MLIYLYIYLPIDLSIYLSIYIYIYESPQSACSDNKEDTLFSRLDRSISFVTSGNKMICSILKCSSFNYFIIKNNLQYDHDTVPRCPF